MKLVNMVVIGAVGSVTKWLEKYWKSYKLILISV